MHLINVPTMAAVISHVAIAENEPVMFHGPPGCGKSEGTEAAAKVEDAVLIDERLGQYDSVDLRGLPDLDAENGMTTWRMPDSIPFEGNPRFRSGAEENPVPRRAAGGEASGARRGLSADPQPPHRQPSAAAQHVHRRAGNRDGDKGVQNKLPAPLNNRSRTTRWRPTPRRG
jgi:hypothetical protein